MIQFQNVSKRYPEGHDALRDVNFTLDRGEMAFLTGHSGAGKSTLLKLIMLMERPTRGQVAVAQQNLAEFSREDIPYHRRRIGVVFQNHQLLFDRNVFENIALPLQISGYEPDDIGKRVRAALDKVGLLSKEKINPLLGASGVSAVPGSAREVHVMGQKEDPSNFLLMHAMACNSSGVIGSAICAGILWSFMV